jgi:DNA-3-methyladenine glycosylase I
MSTSKTVRPVRRCAWADGNDPVMRQYHDDEWGKVERDGRALWEKLSLDAFQAGLSWRTILYKREAFRKGFAGFVPAKVAKFGEREVERLMGDAGIVRSRPKILACIGNAKAFLAMEKAGEDFSEFAWSFVGGKPRVNRTGIVPAKTEESEALSKALKKRGFAFTGPVAVYAWMQATGMVDDHARDCFRHASARRGKLG